MTPNDEVPAYRSKPLCIACAQYDAKLGEISRNIRRVEEMLKDLKPGAVDLLVLPEMALTGYVFDSPTHIAPFLERPRIGPSSLFCRSLAQRLQCYVACGYPERPEQDRPDGRGYNSACLVAPSGEVLLNYRKSFLYDTDERWAVEGDGFSYIDLPAPLGRVSLAICMDINPKGFTAPWDAYELSTFCLRNGVDLLVLCANWLSAPPSSTATASSPDEADDDDEEHPDGPSLDTLNYWAHRLVPLHDPPPPVEEVVGQEADGKKQAKETLFVACNRVGVEAGSRFVGTSTVLRLTPPKSGVSAEKAGGGTAAIEVLDCLGKKEEMVLFVTIP